MNKQKLLKFINNPRNISQSDLDDLQQLVEQYPYFQIGHALIAKVKSDNKTLDNRDKLHLAAITTADRNVLKALISRRLSDVQEASTPVQSTEVESPVVKEESKPEAEEIKSEAAPTISEETAAGEKEPTEEKTADQVAEEKVEEKIEDTAKSSDNTKKEEDTILLGDLSIKKSSDTDKAKVNISDDTKKTEDPKDNLYKELEENLRSLQRRKSKPASQPEPDKPEKAEKKTSTTAKTTPARKTTGARTTVKKTTTAKSATVKQSKGTASKTTSTSASKSTSAASKKAQASKAATTKKAPSKSTAGTTKTTTASKKTESKTTPAKTKAASEKKTETSKKKLQKTVSKSENQDSKKKDRNSQSAENRNQQTEIIEEFIKKDPSITKPTPGKTQENVAQEDLSLKSIEIKEDLISENLAIIMEKQGKIQKAKDIYKKLIWKFPQKKAYFASRIEELERS